MIAFLKDNKYIGILVLIWVIAYIGNVSKYPFGGDSSEIVSAMSSWGIAHPPGYPLLMLVGNIWNVIIPISNIYIKLSILSAIFVLLTSIMLYKLTLIIYKKPLLSLIGSIFYLFLFPVWLYGLVPEVFSLANLLITLQMYFLYLLVFEKSSKQKQVYYLYLFILCIGLSISHHHAFILFVPAYLYLFYKNRKLLTLIKNNIFQTAFVFLFSISFYIYAPIVSFFQTKMDIENAKTLEGFLRLITRSSYGTFKAYVGSGGDFLNRILDVLSSMVFILLDFKPLGLIFILLGIMFLIKTKQLKLLNFLTIIVLTLFAFYFYTNFFLAASFGSATFERFLTLLYPSLIILFVGGIYFAYQLLNTLLKKYTDKKIFSYFISLFLLSITVFLITNTYISNNNSISTLKSIKDFENFGNYLLDTMPKQSIFLPQSDHAYFLTEHQQIVYKKRYDIIITPLIIDRSYIKKRLKKNFPFIILPYENNLNWEKFLQDNYNSKSSIFSDRPMEQGIWVPYGLLWKYYPNIDTFKPDTDNLIQINKNLWNQYKIPQISKGKKSILFINDIKDYFVRQNWAYINFLSVLNKPEIAREEAEKNIKDMSSDFKYLISYINIKVALLECDVKVKTYVDKALQYNIQASVDYLPLLNYLKYCTEEKNTYNKLYEKYLKQQKYEDKPLEKI